MKVFNEEDTVYLGVVHNLHAFLRHKRVGDCYDPEIILVPKARMNQKDGTSKFFDPIYDEEGKNNVRVRETLADLRDIFLGRERRKVEITRVDNRAMFTRLASYEELLKRCAASESDSAEHEF